MRLIDADALIKEMERWDWQELYLPIHFKELLIDDAPTIEPSKVDLRTDESANIGTEVNDLISREGAVKAVARYMMDDALIDSNYASEDINDWIEIGQSILEDVPTADAVSREDFTKAIKAGLKLQAELNADRPTGEWKATENDEMEVSGYYCSNCDLPLETEEKTNYCPNCGARMEGPDHDERRGD